MSAEHEPQSSEALSPRQSAELAELARSAETAPNSHIEAGEKQQDQIEAARAKIEQQAEQQPSFEEKAPKPKAPVTRLDKAVAYRHTLKSLQRHLSPASRSFSKVIHQPAVEKTSEVLGATVLRPSVTLGATLTAVIVESILYFTARHYGFALRGSEIILSLIAGAILGLIIEAISKLLHHRKLR